MVSDSIGTSQTPALKTNLTFEIKAHCVQGNWLFQPTEKIANILAKSGIKIDSSFFKGGLQYYHKLDYRRAIGNGYFWKFNTNVNTPDLQGILFEIPIHTKM